jgi:FKBP-type peptidyl-prolyl cis-trans isomerase FkpA
VLKNVKLLVLMDKTINLRFQKKLMRRLLYILGLSTLFFAGCKKDGTVANQAKAQAAIDDQIITDYLTKKNLTSTFTQAVKDSSGLWYSVTNAGGDKALFSPSTRITVGYNVKLLNTDSVLIKTDTFHPSFSIGETIKAWSLCIPKAQIGKGGTLRIITASRYAYGPYDQSQSLGLRPNSVLDFEITLYDITN